MSVMEVIKADINRWLGTHEWSPSEILTELASIAESRAASFGANHYEAVLYRASSASPALVEYCQAQDTVARLRSSLKGGRRFWSGSSGTLSKPRPGSPASSPATSLGMAATMLYTRRAVRTRLRVFREHSGYGRVGACGQTVEITTPPSALSRWL